MERKNLFAAIAALQQEAPVIVRGSRGYSYNYASLPEILEVINPLCQKYNLGFTQLLDGDCLVTIVFHTKTGENLESRVQIPQNVSLKGMNDFQVAGSSITYYRRYSLSAIFGIVTDEDNDAGGQQEEKKQTQRSSTKPKLETITPQIKNAIDAYFAKGLEPDGILAKMEEKFTVSDNVKKSILNGEATA